MMSHHFPTRRPKYPVTLLQRFVDVAQYRDLAQNRTMHDRAGDRTFSLNVRMELYGVTYIACPPRQREELAISFPVYQRTLFVIGLSKMQI